MDLNKTTPSTEATKGAGQQDKGKYFIEDTQGYADVIVSEQEKMPDILQQRMIDLRADYPNISFLLQRGEVGCFPLGDIIALKAKAKAGKSTTLKCIIVALFRDFMGFSAKRQDNKVLFIDTEMNSLNTVKMAKEVHHLCSWSEKENNPKFILLNLREDMPEVREKIIENAIKFFQPNVVCLDGVKDLIASDINDHKEGSRLVGSLLKWCKIYNCTIITILHENKNDQNLRGSIGTELLNKCSECWQVKKDGDVFIVEQTECRNAPVDGFSFTLSMTGIPEEINHQPKKSKEEIGILRKAENLRNTMKPHQPLPYSTLITSYSETAPCAPKTAEKHIAEAVKRGWMSKDNLSGQYLLNPLHLPT